MGNSQNDSDPEDGAEAPPLAPSLFFGLVAQPPGVSTVFEMRVTTVPLSSRARVPAGILEPLIRDTLGLEYPLKRNIR